MAGERALEVSLSSEKSHQPRSESNFQSHVQGKARCPRNNGGRLNFNQTGKGGGVDGIIFRPVKADLTVLSRPKETTSLVPELELTITRF